MAHRSSPGPDTGHFSTLEVRPRSSPPVDITTRLIRFPAGNYSAAPNVAGGFTMLDLAGGGDDTPAVRANLVGSDISAEGMRIGLETWDGGVMRAAGACWVEHKAGARECHFGQVDSLDVERAEERKRRRKLRSEEQARRLKAEAVGRGRRMELKRTFSAASDSGISVGGPVQEVASGGAEASEPEDDEVDGRQDYTTLISFPVKFRSPPRIVTWLNRLDIPTSNTTPSPPFRLRSTVSDVTNTTASLSLSTWGPGSRLTGAAACWIVFPSDKKHIDSGSFGVRSNEDGSSKRNENSGYVEFRQGWFERPPTVLAALDMFDVSADADLKIEVKVEDVTSHGFKWRLNTWDDSQLNNASASWIALGFV